MFFITKQSILASQHGTYDNLMWPKKIPKVHALLYCLCSSRCNMVLVSLMTHTPANDSKVINEAHSHRFCSHAHLFPDHTLLFFQRSFTTRPRMVLPWKLKQREQNQKKRNKGKKTVARKSMFFLSVGHENDQNQHTYIFYYLDTIKCCIWFTGIK